MTGADDPRDVPHHPRRRSALVGHEAAERKLKDAYVAGRLHSAWLIGGPRGVGKATLAYRFARFVLSRPGEQAPVGPDIDIAPDHPAASRVAAGAHCDLLSVERAFDPKTGRVRSETTVDLAREVPRFFSKTAGEGGWRVCIVDTADDLNEASANTLLKIIEEPPSRSLIMLVSNAPGRLLATIRSRCAKVALAPLDDNEVITVLQSIPELDVPASDLVLAGQLARGSPGRALELLDSGASKLFAMFRDLLSQLPELDIRRALAFAEQLQGRKGDDGFGIFCELLNDWIAAKARSETARSLPTASRWAVAHGELGRSIERTNALNLDRRQFVMHVFETLRDAAQAID